MIMIVALMISLGSCRSLRPQIVADISFQFDRCRVRCFDFEKVKEVGQDKCDRFPKTIPEAYADYFSEATNSKGYTYLTFKKGNYSLGTCDMLIGVSAIDYANEIRPWAKSVRKQCR